MKVHIVRYNSGWGDNQIDSVYDSKDKAEARRERMRSPEMGFGVTWITEAEVQ